VRPTDAIVAGNPVRVAKEIQKSKSRYWRVPCGVVSLPQPGCDTPHGWGWTCGAGRGMVGSARGDVGGTAQAKLEHDLRRVPGRQTPANQRHFIRH
jgi:hypothetical protein